MNKLGSAKITSVFIGVFLLFALITGYFLKNREQNRANTFNSVSVTPIGVNPQENQSDLCNFIQSSNFSSIKQHEGGLGPDGPTMINWGITFNEGKFEWYHSDVTESGTFSCTGSILEAKFNDYTITASYDKDTKILVWDDVEYMRVDANTHE